MRKIPKTERYTIGQKTFEYLLEIVTNIARAEYYTTSEKIKVLIDANHTLDVVKILVRLTRDLQIIEEWTYLEIVERIHLIGKMLGGWIRALQSPPKSEGIKKSF